MTMVLSWSKTKQKQKPRCLNIGIKVFLTSINIYAYIQTTHFLFGLVFDQDIKDSFLRALREVAPEMELLWENHQQYMKNFVMKLSTIRHFTKKLYLARFV